jgi:hypothetical protein
VVVARAVDRTRCREHHATTMFVRFRQGPYRLQVSIVEAHRVAGSKTRQVKQKHVASLGSIETPPSVADRIAFWKGLHERLARLANRIDGKMHGEIFGAVHAKVPMVTPDEQRALQRENFEADEKLWNGLHDMHAGTVEGTKDVVRLAENTIASGRAAMARAAEARDAAKAKRERLDRGEDVSGGLGRVITREDWEAELKRAGSTDADLRGVELTGEIADLGGFDELKAEMHKRREASYLAAKRAVLRRLRRRSAE